MRGLRQGVAGTGSGGAEWWRATRAAMTWIMEQYIPLPLPGAPPPCRGTTRTQTTKDHEVYKLRRAMRLSNGSETSMW